MRTDTVRPANDAEGDNLDLSEVCGYVFTIESAAASVGVLNYRWPTSLGVTAGIAQFSALLKHSAELCGNFERMRPYIDDEAVARHLRRVYIPRAIQWTQSLYPHRGRLAEFLFESPQSFANRIWPSFHHAAFELADRHLSLATTYRPMLGREEIDAGWESNLIAEWASGPPIPFADLPSLLSWELDRHCEIEAVRISNARLLVKQFRVAEHQLNPDAICEPIDLGRAGISPGGTLNQPTDGGSAGLAKRFRDLANEFRAVAATPTPNGGRQLVAMNRRAGVLLRQAVRLGFVKLQKDYPWPSDAVTTDDEHQAAFALEADWTLFVASLDEVTRLSQGKTGMPPKLMEMIPKPMPSGSVVTFADSRGDDWAIRARNYGAVCDILAEECGDGVPTDAADQATGGGDTASTDVESQAADAKPKANHPRRRYRPRSNHGELTPKQMEAVKEVGECAGNIAKAARRLGKDASTVRQAYNAGLAKLGITAHKHKRTISIARDARGNESISYCDDRRRSSDDDE
jgi:DNA-binding NarL/FixJ family response regulator